MNVLIVEDNPISAKVLEHPLDKYGYDTLTAHDGDQALEFLESHPEIELLITDIMMPKTNGVELVRKIKERQEGTELPILVATPLKPTSINNAIPMQGWKYLFKPIKADSLIRMVKEAISQQRAVLQSPDQTMAEIGMDSQAFLEILDEFLKVVKDKIALLEERIKQPSDAPLDLQHLMESAKLVRADRVIDVIERLNRVADGTKRESIRSMYPLLLRELKAMQHYLTLYAS